MGFCSAPAVNQLDTRLISAQFTSGVYNETTCARDCRNDFNCPTNKKVRNAELAIFIAMDATQLISDFLWHAFVHAHE